MLIYNTTYHVEEGEDKNFLIWMQEPVSYTHLDVYKRQLVASVTRTVYAAGQVGR